MSKNPDAEATTTKIKTAFFKGSEYYMNRRNLLKLGVLGAVTALSHCSAISAAAGSFFPEKSVSLYNVHTGENLRALYWSEGKYHQEVLDDINYILRDFRTGKIQAINPQLLDFLNFIQTKLGTRQYFHVVSGYRSPATNELLRKIRKGVAKNSMHLYGKAVDFRVPKHNLALVCKAALSTRYGGVGYYPDSNFIHVDVGEVRYWQMNSDREASKKY